MNFLVKQGNKQSFFVFCFFWFFVCSFWNGLGCHCIELSNIKLSKWSSLKHTYLDFRSTQVYRGKSCFGVTLPLSMESWDSPNFIPPSHHSPTPCLRWHESDDLLSIEVWMLILRFLCAFANAPWILWERPKAILFRCLHPHRIFMGRPCSLHNWKI